MREIKFREWRDSGGYHYWGIMSEDNFTSPCHPRNTQEQFTGLLDKNGVEVYEGDIIKRETEWHKPTVAVIRYHKDYCAFVWQNIRNKMDDLSGGNFDFMRKSNMSSNVGFEVIGNIHENQELMEAL